MINPMRVMFQRLYNTIPRALLEAAFHSFEYDVTLDELIKQKVILARVLDDVSVRGGPLLKLLLRSDWMHYTSSPSPYALGMSGSYSIFHIPPEARDHRDMACAIQVRFPYSINTSNAGGLYTDCASGGNTMGQLACATLSSVTGSGVVSMPRANILPGNIIKLIPPQFNFIPWQVTVRLKYDNEFTGMEVSSIHPFAQACEYAVKAYIYTNMLIEVESNVVYRGVELGTFRELVTSYQDANERYTENLISLGGAQQLDVERLHQIFARMRR